MSESVERYFRMMPVGRHARPTERMWCPAADVIEVADGWIVKLELAGVEPDEVEIRVEERALYVTGTRRDAAYVEDGSYHQMEITYSRFYKKISFPEALRDVAVERVARHGLLLLRLRRK